MGGRRTEDNAVRSRYRRERARRGGRRRLNTIVLNSFFRGRERFMFLRKTGWQAIAAAVITALLLSACTQTGSGTGSPTPGASSAGAKVLRMARNAEPFSPFVPWQIDDNPTLFISVNIYDTLLRTTKDGTGAYYSEGWKKGDPIILKRNTNYWKGTPALDEVRIEYIPDDNTRVLKLQGGETDVVDFVPFSQIATLNTQQGIKAQTFSIQQTAFIILNNSKPPLNDVKVRQALNYATDKDAIIKNVYFGQATAMNSPIPQGTYYDKSLPGYPYNLDKAKQLMAQSAGASGFTVDMQVRSGNTNFANTAVILKDAWAKIGVTVNIQTLDTAVVRTNYRAGDYMTTPSAWTNDMNDPTEIVNYAMRGGASPFAYWTRYNNPDLNDKITKADLEQDTTKRAAMYSEIQKIYLDAAPLVFIAYLGATAGWRNNVEGFYIDGLSYYRFEDVKINK